MSLNPFPVCRWIAGLLSVAVAAGCATRAADVQPLPADPADYASWTCARMHDEMDAVQQQAVDLSWTVDERAGQHVVALGLGLTVFWPALLAMRPDGAEAESLARLKGQYDALQTAARRAGCPPPSAAMAPERVAAMPVLPGESLVYEERDTVRDPLRELTMTMVALRRDEIEFRTDAVGVATLWRQDLAGNVIDAAPGVLVWRRLLKRGVALGEVLTGEVAVNGDSDLRARVRGQVVALGPQSIAGRAFEAAVIELFGDVSIGATSTRLEGAIVVDRDSGLLLRLDLRSAHPRFQVQRRLVRVDSAR